MVDGSAEGANATRVWVVAWILALLVDAGETIFAAVIETAAHHTGVVDAHLSLLAFAVLVALEERLLHDGLAIIIRVAIKVEQATALRSMQNRLTLSIETARCLCRARVDAFAVVAGTIECAVGVASAARDALALVANFTRVAGIIVVALFEHIHTVVSVAHLARTTLTVVGALIRLQALLVLLAIDAGVANMVRWT